jgi:acyl-CoA synthetase (AMP-forming)/AMP-acid ligase II
MTLNWAVHMNNGVSSPANAAYNADELAYQLENSGSQSIFTVLPLLETALAAASKVGIPKSRIYLCEMPEAALGGLKMPSDHKTLAQLTQEGASLPPIEPLRWSAGQGARQTAFLCYSSGTSGLAKGVMISHRNVIANTMQIALYDKTERDKLGEDYLEVALGLLPQSHIYGLIVICQVSVYRGDQVVVLPKFDIQQYLTSIARFRINILYIVPPIIIAMVKNQQLLSKFDLSSVRCIFTGAAPLGKETAEELAGQYPNWKVRQGYGLTETCTVVSSSSPVDIWFGSSGCLIPGYEAKLMSAENVEITGYDQPGELWVKSPSVVLGYLKNEKATKETFVDEPEGRFMKTGDEAVFRKAPSGNEHVWIVDRIKELIKVKVRDLIFVSLKWLLTVSILGHASCARRAGSLSA